MSDHPDRLLQALGKLAREQRDELSTQSSQDEIDLLAAHTSPQAHERYTSAVLQGLAEGQAISPPRSQEAQVIALPRRRKGPLIAAASGLLAVAATLLVLFRAPSPEMLPSYELRVHAGEQAMRSSEPSPAQSSVVGPQTPVLFEYRPEKASPVPVEAGVYLIQGNSIKSVQAPVEISPEGAVRIRGSRQAVFGETEPGEWDVVIVLAEKGKLAALKPDPNWGLSKPPEGLRIARYHLTFRND